MQWLTRGTPAFAQPPVPSRFLEGLPDQFGGPWLSLRASRIVLVDANDRPVAALVTQQEGGRTVPRLAFWDTVGKERLRLSLAVQSGLELPRVDLYDAQSKSRASFAHYMDAGVENPMMMFWDVGGQKRLDVSLNGSSDLPQLDFFDAKGKGRVALAHSTSVTGENPYMALRDANGQTRLEASVGGAPQRPQLSLRDAQGKCRASLFTFIKEQTYENPGLWFYDPAGKQRVELALSDGKDSESSRLSLRGTGKEASLYVKDSSGLHANLDLEARTQHASLLVNPANAAGSPSLVLWNLPDTLHVDAAGKVVGVTPVAELRGSALSLGGKRVLTEKPAP